MRLDHAGAGTRWGDQVVAILEFGHDLRGQGFRVGTIAGVVGRLAAARLRRRHENLRSTAFEELDRRKADRRPHQIDETGDEEADAHEREGSGVA